MESIKKIASIFFAGFFALTAILALVLFNFDRRGFSAETYQKAFAKEGFYNELPAVLAEAIMTTDQTRFPVVMRGMSKQAWEDLFRAMLSPEALKAMGDDLLNSTFAYINMQTNSVQFSLAPLKTGMVSDSGVQAVFTLLNSQPDCTLNEIAQMSIDLLSGGEMQFCKPPAELTPLLTPVVQEQLQLTSLLIPDQLTIVTAPPRNDPRQKLLIARTLMRLSPVLPLAFLLLLTVLAIRSLRDWLNWWGIPFLVTGLLAGLMGLGGAPIFSAIFQRILIFRLPDYLPPILLKYVGDLASAMLEALLAPVMWQGLAISFIGLAMTLAAYLLKLNQQRKSSMQ